MWNSKTKELIAYPIVKKEKGILCIAVCPDDKLIATGSGDKRIRLWDISSCEMKGEPLIGHLKSVLCVAFSTDGKKLASGSRDRSVKIWGLENGYKILFTLASHKG